MNTLSPDPTLAVPSSPPSKSPRARILAVGLLAGAITQLILAASAGGESPTLEKGKPIERAIAADETHTYRINVPPDRVVTGVIEQRGVDVKVRVIDPAGATVATLDSPNGASGPEPWILEGRGPGVWRLEVSPFPGSEPGRYEARIDAILTAEERAAELAKDRYQSPRLLQLWRELRAGGDAALDHFAKEMEGHAPLVEPVPGDPRGDVLITFVRRALGGARYVGIIGAPASRALEANLLRFEGTDLFYLTTRSPKDARFTYNLRVGDPLSPAASRREMDAAFAHIEPDAWNPRTLMGRSLVELPGAPSQRWTERTEGAPTGRVVPGTIHSEILNEDRKLGVYLPASFDPAKGPYPYVILFDGEVYGLEKDALVPTPTILDNLIAQGKVPPTLGVLLASGGTRDRDLPMSAPFAEFLAKELAPWLRREYKASDDPSQATLAGSSFGGLCGAYAALHHSEVFGNVLSQSGSYWFTPGALSVDAPYALEPGALMREVIAAPAKPVRFWMEVGLFEDSGAPLTGSNQLAQSRHMRDLLLAKGYSVTYSEYTGGHDYACWRGSLADGLMSLAEPPARPAP